MEGISKKEIKIISDLEFREKYYFRKRDIKRHFCKDTQITKAIFHLRKKNRIIKLNKDKYYLIPIKARSGRWTDHPYIVADEIFDGEGYFIGGWAAANYWKITDQVPMKIDVWTTKRQGKATIMGIRFFFHRTTQKRIRKSVIRYLGSHPFRILNKEESQKWTKSKL